MPLEEGAHSICMSPFNKLPTRDLVINCGTGSQDRVFFDPDERAVVNSNCEIRNPSEGEPPNGPG